MTINVFTFAKELKAHFGNKLPPMRFDENGVVFHESCTQSEIDQVNELIENHDPDVGQLLAKIEEYERAIDQHVDNVARGMGYNSSISCASYVSSTVAKFRNEAVAFIAWRDNVWTTAHNLLNSGNDPGTSEAVIALLPTFVRPS